MAEAGKLKPCALYVVRYVPDLVRDEALNIGLFLHSPEQEYLDCIFTDDLRRVRRFHPKADLELLGSLQEHFEQEIKEHEADLEAYLHYMQETYSNILQLTPPRTCLLRDPQAEIQDLFARYVSSSRAAPLVPDTRMRIKQRLTAALESAGVLAIKRFRKLVPAEQLTREKGDPFCFDYGYKPNGHVKLIHALSVTRDQELGESLAFKMGKIRNFEPVELTAVYFEDRDASVDERAEYTKRVLQEAQIHLQPLWGVADYAQSVRRELMM